MKIDHKSRTLFVALAIALLFLPFLTDALLGRGWVRIIDFSMLYIMLALGLNIVVGYAGLLDLGYIAFFAVGAYCYALTGSPHLAQAFPVLFADGLHLSFWIVLPLAALVAGGFGVLLGAPTLRLRGDYLAIITLGFGEIIRIFLNNLNAPVNLTNGPQGISRIDPINVAGVSLNTTQEIFGITLPSVHLYFYLFLDFCFAAAGKIAHRSRVDGDTRRRNRRFRDGYQYTQPQAAGVRDGRDVRRRVRRTVRRIPGLRQPGKFQPDGIHHGVMHGGAGRHGQYRRCDSRRRVVGAVARGVAPYRRADATGIVRQDAG
jgi:hypothetical protein